MRVLPLIISVALLFSSCTGNKVNDSEVDTRKDSINWNPEASDMTETESTDTLTNSVPATDPDPRIAKIQSEFRRINTGNFKSEKIDFVCDEKGSITYFTENGDVSKIILDWGFVGDGSLVSEYYFMDDELIFVYDVIIAMPPGQETFRKERRSYVENDKVIRYIEDQKKQPCETCSFDSNARAYKVLNAYGTKDYKAAICE